MRTEIPEIPKVAKQLPLIVVPCLNEAEHIAPLLTQLARMTNQIGGRVVVVDGGSTDGTWEIVSAIAERDSRISRLDNPRRIQSAAINLAVAEDRGVSSHLIRVDAHCRYPDDYCARLLAEMDRSGADSVAVSMIAEGKRGVEALNAMVQNSTVGNGGSRHRMRSEGQFVDHGHHALIRLDAFRAVGGYDPSFSHNEDAELDFRLRRNGYRIWLAADPVITYIPRRSFGALARQYFNYGRGRARTMLKHATPPQLRQTKVMMVLPAVVLSALTSVHWIFAVPAALWLGFCIASGVILAVRHRRAWLALTSVSAMLMHVAWSVGFWRQILGSLFAVASAAPLGDVR
ncbi:succinoglycan biosynthesis protein ExoA [Roseovarius azorensis]|uniref:Succinoglycan biosynthesis protein ExoA n=1 Tax=Roseovarius azorensis TaxID=1287727 RepID=A0A1H7KL20_9RHOB|nr:glycosyltransferase family 2 protein [Roseovarius azorensis]SEK87468.1 succinoglycan biosynthesis protein ExoA [Roseovarius azorensis]